MTDQEAHSNIKLIREYFYSGESVTKIAPELRALSDADKQELGDLIRAEIDAGRLSV